ncbi:hypothetical protein JAAARDRAFT_660879 [Jaapia argillacea MUCL 33604]|uniref:Uncharacterized protein n=1 Tax=Jaapia argillacea MUCL 33604 TaxID=933084 RepID=A0A067P3G4_9AGAM|nr:hypothetical protein JAAARDRAFT_660879 [Jaapia argillacea MUCL 33604]
MVWQSIIRTRSDTPSDLLDDDEAEATVTHPKLIILPYGEEPDMNDKDEGRKGRRKSRKPTRLGDVVVQRALVLAKADLNLNVAMAVGVFVRVEETKIVWPIDV